MASKADCQAQQLEANLQETVRALEHRVSRGAASEKEVRRQLASTEQQLQAQQRERQLRMSMAAQ